MGAFGPLNLFKVFQLQSLIPILNSISLDKATISMSIYERSSLVIWDLVKDSVYLLPITCLLLHGLCNKCWMRVLAL